MSDFRPYEMHLKYGPNSHDMDLIRTPDKFLRFIYLKWTFRPYINSSKYGRNTGIVKRVRIHLLNHTDGIVDFFILTVQIFKKYGLNM